MKNKSFCESCGAKHGDAHTTTCKIRVAKAKRANDKRASALRFEMAMKAVQGK